MIEPSSSDERRQQKTASGCLVVGANRGIGLALTQQLLAGQSHTVVLATYRPGADTSALVQLQQQYPTQLRLLSLQLTDAASHKAFNDELGAMTDPIGLAIHSAGVLHGPGLFPERTVQECDARQLQQLFEINSIAPLMVAKALLQHQGRSQPFVFAALSAMVGSISDNRLGGWYGYRASKAALNQFIKTLANECRLRHPKASIVAIHPGTTDTELSRPFQANVKPGKLYSADQTAQRILALVHSLDAGKTGRFFHWDGSEIPW